MKTNLIQAYVNNPPTLAKSNNSEKAKADFNVRTELRNRTFIRPLPGHGYLIKHNIFEIPADMFKQIKYDIKAFKHALNGKANDHELGSLNDFGMKLGGLTIATYLFTRKSTPLTKVMEFAGFTTFFAAMDLWPKLALQLPARIIHGFDIRQNYRDNFGTKKPVFLDHQFIPWDLYSDEEINRIGDRMNVPKDMKNRRDFIQEKMRKIALQNNTMWMLTSGFATPIMSALLCNALEKPVNKVQDKYYDAKANEIIETFNEQVQSFDYTKKSENLNKILEENVQKPITKDLLKQISEIIGDGLDEKTKTVIARDLDRLFVSDGFEFSKDSFKVIEKTIKREFSHLNLTEENLKVLIPTQEEMSLAFKELLSNGADVKDFSTHIRKMYELMQNKVDHFAKNCPDSELVEDLNYTLNSMLHSNNIGKNPRLSEVFTQIKATKLTDNIMNSIRKIAEVVYPVAPKLKILDRYAYIKAAQAPETLLANSWNNISEGLLKTFGITSKEAAEVRYNRDFVGKLLRNKFENIVSNDELYKQVIEDLGRKLSYLDARTTFGDISQDNLYKKAVDATFDDASRILKEMGMTELSQRLTGAYIGDTRSLKDAQITFITNRVKGVKNSFYRILNALDMYRRISKVENVNDALHKDMLRVMKEEVVEMCKELVLNGHASDYAVKFYYPVDMDINTGAISQDKSMIETFAGRVVNRYARRHGAKLGDNPYDKNFFEAAMKLMYKEELHRDTSSLLSNSTFYQDFLKFRWEIFNAFGGDKYFAKPWHKIENTFGGVNSEQKFLLVGAAPDEMFTKLCSQKFNGNKWLKIFGGTGLVLLAVTTISQFFMGHMSNDKLKENK